MSKKTQGKIVCEKDGEVKYGLVDGYNFGDRLLEDVMFRITYINNEFKATIDPDSREYFEELNTKKWLKEAEDYAKNTDLLICPKCNELLIPVDWITGKKKPEEKWVPVPVRKFSDLLNDLDKAHSKAQSTEDLVKGVKRKK